MTIKKNVASQKLAVYAYDPTTAAGTDPSKTGDAANISAQISLDGGASAATNDVAPTELDAVDHPGVYIFDLTQAETNAEMILLSAVSSTSNILLDPIQVLTIPEKVTLADVAHGGVAATLALKQLDVIQTAANGNAITVTGMGTGEALHLNGGASGNAIYMGSGSQPAIYAVSTSSYALELKSNTASGVHIDAASMGEAAIQFTDGSSIDDFTASLDAIKAKTDDLTFTVANQVDANALTGGYSASATIQSPVPSATTIEVINADRYDGTAAPLLTWTVTKDYSAATTVKLVIYKKGYPDTIYKTATGVVASATSITVDLDVDFGDSITFSGVPLKSELGFALVADWSGEEETIARGDCYVYDRGVPA